MKRILPLLLFVMMLIAPTVEAKDLEQLIIINKATNELVFYDNGMLIKKYSVATGREAGFTPEGKFKVIVKAENVPYYKLHIPGGAPNNPLGPRWIGLDVPGTWGYTYGIHGNSNESSIGTYASSGCVRMHNKEVKELYSNVKTESTVIITRSNKTFDEIAIENGYQVKNVKKEAKIITLIKKTVGYSNPSYNWTTEKWIEEGTYQLVATFGDWKEIKTNDNTYWLNTEDYVEGTLEKVDQYVKLNENQKVDSRPNETNYYSFEPKNDYLHVTKKTPEWFYVTDENGYSGWLKNEENLHLTKNEYEKIKSQNKKIEKETKVIEQGKEKVKEHTKFGMFLRKIIDFFDFIS